MPKNQSDIEALRKRYQDLDRERTRTQANLDNARKQLDELKKQAREQYGTDDPDALRKKLEDMRAENERRRADYQKHLEEIESRLEEVERDHSETVESRST